MEQSRFVEFVGIDKRETTLKGNMALFRGSEPGSMFETGVLEADMGNGTVFGARKFHERGEMRNNRLTPIGLLFGTRIIIDAPAGIFLPELAGLIKKRTAVLQESGTAAFLSVDDRLRPGMRELQFAFWLMEGEDGLSVLC